jgi:hypothetical protein
MDETVNDGRQIVEKSAWRDRASSIGRQGPRTFGARNPSRDQAVFILVGGFQLDSAGPEVIFSQLTGKRTLIGHPVGSIRVIQKSLGSADNSRLDHEVAIFYLDGG